MKKLPAVVAALMITAGGIAMYSCVESPVDVNFCIRKTIDKETGQEICVFPDTFVIGVANDTTPSDTTPPDTVPPDTTP